MARSKTKGKISFVFMLVVFVLCVAYFVLQHFGLLPWEQKGGRDTKPVTEGMVEIHMIDVGQGDSILIKAPGGNMLIDAGDKSSEAETAIKTYLDDHGVNDFEYVIFTHCDADHIGAADFVMETYNVENVIMPTDDVRTTVVYKEMMTAIKGSGANVINAVSESTYSIGEMNFKVLAPNGSGYKDVNDYSVVVRIDFGESSFLMTGDAEAKSEAEMVAKYTANDLDCDVLKVGHHGSRTSSSAELLSYVTPEIAIISCGEGNKYGHPHKEVVSRLDDYVGEYIYRTDLEGDIVLISDGAKITKNGAVILDESAVG